MSYKIPVREEPLRTVEAVLGSAARYKDTYLHPVFITQRPKNVAIYNVSTTDATWTRVPTAATTLTNILGWRLSERTGNDSHYAFVAAPTAYATAFGWLAENTDIPALWVKRPTTANITAELIVWS